MKHILNFIFLLFSCFSFSQQGKIDSLLRLTESQEGINYINVLIEIGQEYYLKGNLEKTKNYATKLIDYIEKSGLEGSSSSADIKIAASGMAVAYNNLGFVFNIEGHLDEALNAYEKCLTFREKLNNELATAKTLNEIGVIHNKKGNFSQSIAFHLRSLKIREKNKNKQGISESCNNLGAVFQQENQLHKAIEYYKQSLEIEQSMGNKQNLSSIFNNIGVIYKELKQPNEALNYFNSSLKLKKELGDIKGEALTISNIGNVYGDLQQFETAISLLNQSLEIRQKINDVQGIAITLDNISRFYNQLREFEKAIEFANQSLNISFEYGLKNERKDVLKTLSEIYEKKGNYQYANSYYKQYNQLKDSLFNEESSRQIAEMQTKYETDKKQNEIEIQKGQIETKDAENKQQQLLILLIAAIALAAAFTSTAVYRSLRVTKKQKGIIEKQKNIVDEQRKNVEIKNKEITLQKKKVEIAHEQISHKNKEITDSINYAQRIQKAMLPSARLIKEYLPNSFILYKPKDIVAGDFYWMHTSPSPTHNAAESAEEKVFPFGEDSGGATVFIAAADCTGHGVPGAMVSVVCHNALNRTVKEFGITTPARILEKTRELVIEQFNKSDEEVNDGMDISLCTLNTKTNELNWAGANNPLWIIRNNELTEYKPNKQPIGKYIENKPFTNHTLQLQKDDSIYIFTDGYADQFGGEKGKKFKASAMRELLLSIQENTMEEQQEIINKKFEDWKGSIEQVDDVCVIGIILKADRAVGNRQKKTI